MIITGRPDKKEGLSYLLVLKLCYGPCYFVLAFHFNMGIDEMRKCSDFISFLFYDLRRLEEDYSSNSLMSMCY